jgi:uncharacterized protein (DUF1684 family)
VNEALGPSTLAVLSLVLAAAARPSAAGAQSRAAVEAERSEYAAWLATAPVSPRRAVTVRPIGPGLTLGPTSADVPLAGVREQSLQERSGRVSLVEADQTIALPRGRPHTLGAWRLVVSGPPGRTTLTVFAAEPRPATRPAYYPYDPKLALTVSLTPDPSPSSQRILAPDGVEVEATEAGSVSFLVGGAQRTLRVMRLPGATEDESELEIYFRDATADHGTYPAGRFVSLIPQAGGKYLLDFNRARNPFCAYNTVYPCPAPWRGNVLAVPVEAGERYHASPPPPRRPPGD